MENLAPEWVNALSCFAGFCYKPFSSCTSPITKAPLFNTCCPNCWDFDCTGRISVWSTQGHPQLVGRSLFLTACPCSHSSFALSPTCPQDSRMFLAEPTPVTVTCQPPMLTAGKHLQCFGRSSRKGVSLWEGRQQLCHSLPLVEHGLTTYSTARAAPAPAHLGRPGSLGFPRKITFLPPTFCLSWSQVPQKLWSCFSHLGELGTSLSASSCSGIVLIHCHFFALEWKMLLLLSL